MASVIPPSELGAVREIIAQQNLVRGSISELRSKSYKKEGKDPYRRFRSAISRDLLVARSALDPRYFDEYLEWFHQTLRSVVPDHFSRPVGFDYLGGFHLSAPKVSLEREILWTSKRIAHEREIINKFRADATTLEAFVFDGRHTEAIERLKGISNLYGETYWGIQLRIAMENASGGLERQKQYVDLVKKSHSRGVLSFVAFYTSVRNEDRTTWGRFADSFERRLEKTKYDDGIKAYLRLKLLGEWPSNDKSLADVIRLEQDHGIIDLYETLIGLLQHLVTTGSIRSATQIVRVALENLSEINDFRLDKIALATGADRTTLLLPCRKGSVSGALFEGDLKRALHAERKFTSAEAMDPWQTIYMSATHAHRKHCAVHARHAFDTRSHIACVLSRKPQSTSAYDNILKITNNLVNLPHAAGILYFAKTFLGPTKQSFNHIGAVGLNSSFLGYEDLDYINGNKGFALSHLCRHHCNDAMSSSWKVLVNGTPDQADPVSAYFQAVHLYRAGAPSEAVTALDKYREQASEPIKLLFSRLRLACLDAQDDRTAIIELIAREAAENEVAPALLPISDTLATFTWADYKPKATGLQAGIALDALWKATDEDQVATLLRYAFQYQLKRSGCARPSEFADHPEQFDRAEAIYYLRNVCIPSVMDMSKAFKTSADVLEERRSVCAALKALDSDRSEDYDTEIYRITNSKVISDGLRLVDRSRIHVDTDAITRWAMKALKEDFLRYQALVSAGVGSKSDFSDILREIFATIGARQVFFTPDDQSDGLLVDIFMRLREEFLINSDYGLDYFLSKRVRHQSFIGLIRGPLEFENIITTRESEFGPYRRNDFIINRLISLNADEQENVNRTLCSFSEEFDDLLLKVKDNEFQIKSSDKPNGIFDIPVTNQLLFVARSIAQTGVSFDDFASMMYMLFWSAVDPSLQRARKLVAEELKIKISALFDELRGELRLIAENDLFFPSLSTTIGDVSAQVQRSLDEASDWFVRPDGRESNHTFTLRQSIDIAIESALKSHRAFDPHIECSVNGDADLLVPDLILLTDAIFVALDNVKSRSGIKRNANVSIKCDVIEDEGFIELVVLSEIAAGSRTEEKERKLQEIRELIEAGHVGKRARKEGGSGLLKLAAALRHSPGGTLNFGFISDVEFELKLSLKPTKFTFAVIG